MDIDRIRYFCTFADTGSLVRASELLRVSQPALSKALRLLEAEVGCKLMEPDGRGLRLTESGRQLKAAAHPLLNQ
jgi:DNA-binding transcriptional LysR family regulator